MIFQLIIFANLIFIGKILNNSITLKFNYIGRQLTISTYYMQKPTSIFINDKEVPFYFNYVNISNYTSYINYTICENHNNKTNYLNETNNTNYNNINDTYCINYTNYTTYSIYTNYTIYNNNNYYVNINSTNDRVKLVWNYSLISCSGIFKELVNISSIDFSDFDFSLVSNMNEMFRNCVNLLEYINFGTIEITKVESMYCMFVVVKKLPH